MIGQHALAGQIQSQAMSHAKFVFLIALVVFFVALFVVAFNMLTTADIGWRAAFVIGGLLGLIVLFLRRFLPESPRWLMTHGRVDEAEQIVSEIEQRTAQVARASTERSTEDEPVDPVRFSRPFGELIEQIGLRRHAPIVTWCDDNHPRLPP